MRYDKYRVLTSIHTDQIAKEVEVLTSLGWKLHGVLIVCDYDVLNDSEDESYYRQFRFFQSMIFEEEKDNG